MLMLFACFATFLFTSSKLAMLGWAGATGGFCIMEGSGTSDDKVPMLVKAAVTVATSERRHGKTHKSVNNKRNSRLK